MNKTISKGINFILIAIIAYLLFQKFVVNRPEKNIDLSQLVIKDLNGETVNLQELQDQGVFLNFWASWCGPCMAEMPSIKSSIAHFEDQPVKYLLVNTQGRADAQRVAQSEKYQDMPFYYLDKSQSSFHANTIPLTYLIDRNGMVKRVHQGVNHWNSPLTKRQIRQLY